MIKGIFHPGRGLRPVAHSNHDRRRGRRRLGSLPLLERLQPILSEQVVPVENQVRQWLLGLSLPIQVILYLGVVVDVVEP